MEVKDNHFDYRYNFSKVGKFSMNKYSYLIDKTQKINEKLLKFKNRKKLFNDYFQDEHINSPKSEDFDSFFSNDDIFSNTKSNQTKVRERKNDEFQIKSSCSYVNKVKNRENEIFKIREKLINNNDNKTIDKFKYHLLHHNENPNDFFEKKKVAPSCTRYNPKLEYIFKKIIYSIPFKKISGRQEKSLLNMRNKNLIYNDLKSEKNKSNESFKKEIEKNETNYLDSNIHGSINMKYQLPRQSLPNHNDFRIKNGNYDLSLLDKEHNPQSVFKGSKTIDNKRNLINYKNLVSSTQSSLNSLTKRTTKILINNNKEMKELDKIEKFKNKNKYNSEENILKNEKIKYEIKRNKLKNKLINNKINEKNDDKKDNKNLDPSKNNSKILSDYIEFLNQKKIKNNSLSYKSPNNNKKNNKSNLFSSKSCFNLNINKEKTIFIKKKYKGINFDKMLSRTYLNKINKYEEPIHPMITPNYSAIEPKSIMKVLYSKEKINKSSEKFHGLNNEFTYDINKIFNKYNNHISPKAFDFNKMDRRRKDDKSSKLPFFMKDLSDRNSIEYLNENSLKMNNYINGKFAEVKSTFNDKKSYNIRLKLEELKKKSNVNSMEDKDITNNNDDNDIIKKLMNKKKFNINKKFQKRIKNSKEINQAFNKTFKNNSWKNLLGEFYRINYDELEKYNSIIGTKVDAITLKSYNTKDKYKKLLTKKEKKIFEIDFNKDV